MILSNAWDVYGIHTNELGIDQQSHGNVFNTGG